MYIQAISSALCASRHGMNMAILETSWSVTVMIESYPCEVGSFVIQSTAIVEKGVALCSGEIGNNGGFVLVVSALLA